MKKFISAITIIATLFITTNVFALPAIPDKIKPKAEANFKKLYAQIAKDTDIVKIQKLKAGLSKLTWKQPIYQELAPLQEWVKILILQKVEELNTKNPTTYMGCDKPDITIGRQVWSACNVGATVSWTGEESYGDHFAFGTWTKIEDLDRKQYNIQKPKWIEKDQWVCAVNYHIPTIEEFKEVAWYLSCKLSTIPTSSNGKSCGTLVADKLILPSAGYYNNYFTPYGFRIRNLARYNGVYWTSTTQSSISSWEIGFNLDPEDRSYGGVGVSANIWEKMNGLSVRCIRN